MRPILVLQLAIALLLLGQSRVSAQSDDLAKGHYMAGQAYYSQARYPEAIREFEEAYRLSPKPALLFNIAQAYERMGKLDKSVSYLERYIASPGVKDRASEERLKNLRARLRSTGIQVTAGVDGAEVLVDGKPAGSTPLSAAILVDPGSHEIRVTKRGYEAFSAFVSVTPGEVVEVKARLVPSAVAAPHQPPITAPLAASGRSERSPYLWTWVAGGTSAALLVTAAVTGGLALKKTDDANAAHPQDASLADSARTLALVSDVTLGVGLGAAAATAVLFFYERKQASTERQVAITPLLAPGAVGLGALVGF